MRRLAANQGTTGSSASAGKTADKLIENAGLKFFAANVIEKEKRKRTERSNIANAMIHKIGADCIVLFHREGNLQLRANPVDSLHQDGRPVVARGFQVNGTSEAADLSVGAWTSGSGNGGFDAPDELVTGVDVHASCGVCHGLGFGLVCGHCGLNGDGCVPRQL